MTRKKDDAPGAPAEPIDYTSVPQTSEVKKATDADLLKSGYRVPEHFHQLEEVNGDTEALARQRRTEQDTARPGQKQAAGPTTNKAAAPPAENLTAGSGSTAGTTETVAGAEHGSDTAPRTSGRTAASKTVKSPKK